MATMLEADPLYAHCTVLAIKHSEQKTWPAVARRFDIVALAGRSGWPNGESIPNDQLDRCAEDQTSSSGPVATPR